MYMHTWFVAIAYFFLKHYGSLNLTFQSLFLRFPGLGNHIFHTVYMCSLPKSKAEVNIPDKSYLLSVVFVDDIVEQIDIDIFFSTHIGLVSANLGWRRSALIKVICCITALK